MPTIDRKDVTKLLLTRPWWRLRRFVAILDERARADAPIQVHEWDTTHNALKDGPNRVFEPIADLRTV